MSKKPDNSKDGELSEQQLDKVAGGGEEVRKMETVYVTAKRPHAEKVVKMDTVVVTASRERPDLAGTKLAQADTKTKKD
jgi:hypothetical protein